MAATRSGFGDYLFSKRRALGLTQKDVLSRLASYGFHYSDVAVSQWEKNRALPPIQDPNFLKALAEIFGVPSEDILRAMGYELKYRSVPQWLQEFLDTASPEDLKAMRVFLETLAKLDE